MITKKEAIQKITLFKNFNEAELSVLVSCFDLRHYTDGEVIIQKNEMVPILFFVVEGEVVSDNAFIHVEGAMKEFKVGDFFNETAFLGEKPCFVNHTANGNVVLLCLRNDALLDLIEKAPNIAAKFLLIMLENIINTLRITSKFFSKLIQLEEVTSRKAITDNLVGVYNRAFLDEACENFFEISKANKKHLSLLMIDLDNFREINESFGREMGNAILAEAVRIIRSIISSHGIMGRYGGDEFCVLLPEADLEKAREIAELIRKRISSHNFSHDVGNKQIRLTTSIGISTYPQNAADLSKLRASADEALYKAKLAGKNRVMCAL